MVRRVPGAATAGRYARTELYSYSEMRKPDGLTWRDWTFRLLQLYPPELRAVLAVNIDRLIETQADRAKRSIPETEPDPLTGLSWKFLALVASRGDLKGRKRQILGSRAEKTRQKLGVTYEEMREEGERGTRY